MTEKNKLAVAYDWWGLTLMELEPYLKEIGKWEETCRISQLLLNKLETASAMNCDEWPTTLREKWEALQ